MTVGVFMIGTSWWLFALLLEARLESGATASCLASYLHKGNSNTKAACVKWLISMDGETGD
jgi:hypothetical protein